MCDQELEDGQIHSDEDGDNDDDDDDNVYVPLTRPSPAAAQARAVASASSSTSVTADSRPQSRSRSSMSDYKAATAAAAATPLPSSDNDDDDDDGILSSSTDSDSDMEVGERNHRHRKPLRRKRKMMRMGGDVGPFSGTSGGQAFSRMAAEFQESRALQGLPTRKKKNNVWGSILQEETLTSELTGIGVSGRSLKDLNSDRGAETYDYCLAQERAKTEREERERVEKESKEQELDGELSVYWNNKDEEDEMETTNDNDRSNNIIAGQKRSVKDRLGRKRNRNHNSSPTCHFDNMSIPQPGVPRIIPDLNPDVLEQYYAAEEGNESALEAVGEEMAAKLCEPKAELMIGVLGIVGLPVALELFAKTQKIESEGGLMIKNGARRRTPGGLFLQLLRESKDERIDQKAVKVFFSQSSREFNNQNKKKKKKSTKNFDSELKEFRKLSRKKEDELKPLPNILSQVTKSLSSPSSKSENREPEPFSEPEAPPNSVERTISAYDDDDLLLNCETDDIELF